MSSFRELDLRLANVDCPNEAKAIERGFAGFPGVTKLSILASEGRALIAYDESLTSSDSIKDKLKSLGFPPRGQEVVKLGAASMAAQRPIQDDGEHRLTVFKIPKMDCPSEEQMIRMALDGVAGLKSLKFDLSLRELRAVHSGSESDLLGRLEPLNFGAKVSESRRMTEVEEALELAGGTQSAIESRVLKQLMAINATLFVLEIGVGLFAQSAGLIADSLDMFADAVVYGLSLYAVGRAASMKARAARFSGYLQLVLALGAMSEVVRRFIYGSEPQSTMMIAMALVALAANVTCLVLLARHRTGGVHMRASWIFSTNDVIANLGVVAAGILVTVTSSAVPDLLIGSIIAVVVLTGAIRILRVAKAA